MTTREYPSALLVIAKEPVAGRVKTRLSPDYTPAQAARLAAAALADTLDTVSRLPVRRRILVLDGEPGSWLPDGFEVVPQRGDGLDERLANAFMGCPGPALLVGMDTPQLSFDHVAPALSPNAWTGCDAWFGPAVDGGFWALGLADPSPDLLLGIPMSTDHTGAAQRSRLVEAGLRVRDLPRLLDVDTAGDVDTVAALAPKGRFAATARRLAQERSDAIPSERPNP